MFGADKSYPPLNFVTAHLYRIYQVLQRVVIGYISNLHAHIFNNSVCLVKNS